MRGALGLVVAATALATCSIHGALPPPSSLRAEPTHQKVSCDPNQWKLPSDGHYNTSSGIDPTKLNVHLIPHSHDDPGWLINVDEYYVQRVQYILDTVVSELQQDSHRKFMFVEQSFFQRWWHQQSNEIKEITRQLVREGRLDLTVNGGWCMHDEAAPHYIAMIDQTAYGHALLKQEFNVTPRIGWQIDPFGHSSTQGSLLSAGVGFEALYFARIDYQDYNRRYQEKDLEFIWRPSISRGKTMQTFTGQMIDHYGAPGHFHYENDPPIQDDPMLHDFNVCQVVNWFVDDAKKRGDHSKGNHIFIPMGDDFSYVNARKWYKNLDKLIHYVNQDGRVNTFYSNLTYYTDLKRAENLTWSVKKDDFFPYGSDRDEYWSGYFTSRPALKKYARVANQLLQQIRQIDAIYPSHHPADLNALERAVGVVQHHDGISGTEKQAVSDDYSLRLNDGIVAGVQALNQVLFVIGEKEGYSVCLQANASICDIGNLTEKFEVYVHNALPRPVTRTISIPVSHKAIHVTSLSGSSEPKNIAIYRNLVVRPHTLKELPYKVVFSAELQPLSAHRFLVQQLNSPMETQDIEVKEEEEKKKKERTSVTLENELVSVEICTKTGSIVSMTNKQKKITIPLSLEVAYYKAFQGDGRHSGAYMFRPDSKNIYRLNKTQEIQLIPNGIIDPPASPSTTRIAFQLDHWATLEYILNDDDGFLQVEWTVGPIPIEDHQGKEVILRFDTNRKIESRGTLYTDSNGLEFVTRVRNHRDTWDLQLHDDQERVAANYFPIAAAAYIKDTTHQLNIVTDRAQGAASLSDGQVEIMVHRRLLMDDQKGVDQNLNETETFYDPIAKKMITTGLIARGSLYLNIDTIQDGMLSLRQKMESEFFQPLIAFRKPVKDEAVQEKVPWLTISSFPENVGLTTLTERTKNSLLIRLSHLFATGEHEQLSKPVAFDFNTYFHGKNQIITDVTELTLVGTATLEETPLIKNLEWNVEGEDQAEENELASIPLQGTVVQLQAMEVRTFQVTFGKKDEEELITNDVESITEKTSEVDQVEMEKSRISIEQIVAFE